MITGSPLKRQGVSFFAKKFCELLVGIKERLHIAPMKSNKTHTMKYTTTDKHAHQWETFKATEGPATIVASVSKEGPVWNWFVRVAYLKPDGITYIDDAQGREWSKPEARASFEAAASRLIAQMK